MREGRHWLFDPLMKVRVDVANMRDAWLAHDKLDMIVKSGALKDRAVVMDLKDHQRGLVWIDGRFFVALQMPFTLEPLLGGVGSNSKSIVPSCSSSLVSGESSRRVVAILEDFWPLLRPASGTGTKSPLTL